MNIDKVHTPERLEGESQADYKARRRMSTRLAQRGRLLWAPSQGTYFAPGSTSLQRTRMLKPKKVAK